MNYDDAFTIQEVEKEHVDILNHTAGMIPVIRQYIKDVRRTTNDDHHSLSYYSFVCREKKGVELSLEKQRQDLTRFRLLSPISIYLSIYIYIYLQTALVFFLLQGLRELGAFQIEKGEPVKARQKLLRNLRVRE